MKGRKRRQEGRKEEGLTKLWIWDSTTKSADVIFLSLICVEISIGPKEAQRLGSQKRKFLSAWEDWRGCPT